jgi:hypothetical protein
MDYFVVFQKISGNKYPELDPGSKPGLEPKLR